MAVRAAGLAAGISMSDIPPVAAHTLKASFQVGPRSAISANLHSSGSEWPSHILGRELEKAEHMHPPSRGQDTQLRTSHV